MAEKRQFAVIESRQMDHLRVFHEVARALTQTLELEEILQTIMEKMAQFFGPERWSMLMVDEEAQQLYYAIAVGEDAESLRGLRVPMGEGVAGWVASTGNSLVVPDVALDPQWSAFSRAHPELKIQSIACVPVRSGDKTLGVIQLLNSKLDLLSEYSHLVPAHSLRLRRHRDPERALGQADPQLTITDDCTGLFNARHLYTMLDEQVADSGTDLQQAVQPGLHRPRPLQAGQRHPRPPGRQPPAGRGGQPDEALRSARTTPASATAATSLSRCCRAWANRPPSTPPCASGNSSARSASSPAQGLSLALAGSFGLATFPEDGNNVQAIIRAADTMMYAAKITRDNVSVAGLGLVAGSPHEVQVPVGKSATMMGADMATLRA